MSGEYIPREQAIANAARILVQAVRMQAAMTPREQAEGAWYPGHPLGTVEAVEQAVIERRARHTAILAARDAEKARAQPTRSAA